MILSEKRGWGEIETKVKAGFFKGHEEWVKIWSSSVFEAEQKREKNIELRSRINEKDKEEKNSFPMLMFSDVPLLFFTLYICLSGSGLLIPLSRQIIRLDKQRLLFFLLVSL